MRTLLTWPLVLIPAALAAQTLPPLGARSLALGGSGVASAAGPTAPYWNPAGLALQGGNLGLFYGEDVADPEELSPRLDDLAATEANRIDIGSRPADGSRAIELLGAIADEPVAVSGTRSGGAFAGSGNWGVGTYRISRATGVPEVDETRVELSADPDRGLAFNQSRFALRSLRQDEYLVSYAMSFGEPSALAGASLRYSRGTTRVSSPSLFDFAEFAKSDVFARAGKGESKTSAEWSVDLGVLVNFGPKFRVGAVAKYLGSPEYEAADGSSFKIDPVWRLGAALFPAENLMLTADIDAASVETGLGNSKARDIAGGVEYRLAGGRFAVRAGYRNALSGPSSQMISGGIGFAAGGWGADGAIGWSPRNKALSFAIEAHFSRTRGGENSSR